MTGGVLTVRILAFRRRCFLFYCSEYACVGRCVAFLKRRLKLRTVQLLIMRLENATSCVNAGVLPHCHYISMPSANTQSDTAVDQTHSHGPSSSAKLEHTLHAWLEITEAVQCHVINHGQRTMCLGVARAVSFKVETTVAFKVILEGNARSPCATSASDRSRVIL